MSGWSKFMNKKFTFCLILTFLLTNIATAVIDVPSDYSTIQAAIDAAEWTDSIRVADGNYTPT